MLNAKWRGRWLFLDIRLQLGGRSSSRPLPVPPVLLLASPAPPASCPPRPSPAPPAQGRQAMPPDGEGSQHTQQLPFGGSRLPGVMSAQPDHAEPSVGFLTQQIPGGAQRTPPGPDGIETVLVG